MGGVFLVDRNGRYQFRFGRRALLQLIDDLQAAPCDLPRAFRCASALFLRHNAFLGKVTNETAMTDL